MPERNEVFYRPPTDTASHAGDRAVEALYDELGLGSRSKVHLVYLIRDGLPSDTLERFRSMLGVSRQFLLQLAGIPKSTFSRRLEQGRPLTPQESDRLYRLISVYEDVLRLFEGDREAADRWLKVPAAALGGVPPLDYLDTEAGVEAVRDLIGRLEHGVVV